MFVFMVSSRIKRIVLARVLVCKPHLQVMFCGSVVCGADKSIVPSDYPFCEHYGASYEQQYYARYYQYFHRTATADSFRFQFDIIIILLRLRQYRRQAKD